MNMHYTIERATTDDVPEVAIMVGELLAEIMGTIGTWRLAAGNSTYLGSTTLTGGVLNVSVLTNGGSPSSIGQSTNAAANLVLDGGTLRYVGTDGTSNRLFTIGANVGGLESSGTGALNFNTTGAVGFVGSGARVLTLGGTSTAANTLAAVIGNGTGGATSLVKDGVGNWTLTGNNTYTGTTTINAGNLMVGTSAASSSTGTGATIVNSGGVLSGVGTIKGTAGTAGALFADGTPHVVNPGGTLSPGAGFGANRGTLSFTGNLLLQDGSSILMNIAGKTLNDAGIGAALLLGNYDTIGGYRETALAGWNSASLPANAHDADGRPTG